MVIPKQLVQPNFRNWIYSEMYERELHNFNDVEMMSFKVEGAGYACNKHFENKSCHTESNYYDHIFPIIGRPTVYFTLYLL